MESPCAPALALSAAAILGPTAAGSPSRLSPLPLLCRLWLAESVRKEGGGRAELSGRDEVGSSMSRASAEAGRAPDRNGVRRARPPTAASGALEGTWAGGAADGC